MGERLRTEFAEKAKDATLLISLGQGFGRRLIPSKKTQALALIPR